MNMTIELIELLELYLDQDNEIWIADGVRIERKDLIGCHIMRMIVREPDDY